MGVYFVSQNPLDLPDVVLGQFGNRVQHALRAFTPRDQKAVTAAGVRDSMATSMVKSVVRSAGTQVGREIMRGMLGGILGGGRRRR